MRKDQGVNHPFHSGGVSCSFLSSVVATARDRGWLPPRTSPGTAAYCRARDALAAEGLQRAVEHTAEALGTRVSDEHLWLGQAVHVVDGTGIALPDTEANQDDYP